MSSSFFWLSMKSTAVNSIEPFSCREISTMCIAVFMWETHPLYPFILFLNRGEYHNRPTEPLIWWEGGEILGGRDGKLVGHGWLLLGMVDWLLSPILGNSNPFLKLKVEEISLLISCRVIFILLVVKISVGCHIGVDEEKSSCGIICPRSALRNSLGINP
ncbi:hypothetical protein V6Z11_A04G146800 [Gossypium hirsutum]|uniref:Uncharacterized protein n=1 Tax=Gossypium hirsutum TaxID=3635 RepID=A0ABM3BKI3_GOSHI|nr:uncharacterized protein LOC121228241 [Gossypium hirsutum]